MDAVVLPNPSIHFSKSPTWTILVTLLRVMALLRTVGCLCSQLQRGIFFLFAFPRIHTSHSLNVSPDFLSSMEEASFALRDISEVVVVTTCVSFAPGLPLRLQILRWYFQTVWDTSLLDLLQFRFDGLL